MRSKSLIVGSAAVFAVLYLAATTALGKPPAADASSATTTTWLAGHEGHVRTFAWLLVIGLPFFCAASAGLRLWLPSGWRDVYFAGAIAFVVETAIQCWLWGALAFAPATGSPSTPLVFHIALFWGPVLTSATLAMLVPLAVVGLGDHGWPRWMGVLAGVAALEQAIETTTVFGHHGFMAPGGAMNLYLGAGLTAVALFGAVVAVAVMPAPAAAETT
ncbi:MAG TPA: hypothetical protein VG650_17760 [Mycobacteriales bacterium]|nr:hypothetical protein [Mycobacteriales bacterium]